MRQMMYRGALVVGMAAVLVGGAWTVEAQGKKEKHPVLQQSIHQLEAIKDRLQKAPTDFGGHREKAVDAIGHAIEELNQAVAFDKK